MKKFKILKSIKIGLITVLIISKTDFIMGQAENLNVLDNWIEWTDGKNMLVHYLNEQAFAYLDIRDKEIAGFIGTCMFVYSSRNCWKKTCNNPGERTFFSIIQINRQSKADL